MLHRRTCPGCGKVLTLRTEDLGGAVVCGACGRRFEAPRGMDLVGGKGGLPAGARPSPETAVEPGKDRGNGEGALVEPATKGSSASVATKLSPDMARARRGSLGDGAPSVARILFSDRVRSRWLLAAAGVMLLFIGLVVGWLVGRHRPAGADGTSF